MTGNISYLDGKNSIPVSVANPLPVTSLGGGSGGGGSGSATAANQSTEIGYLQTIATNTGSGSGTPTGSAGSPNAAVVSVQGVSGGTVVPVSATALPLPTGAATSALQGTGNSSLAYIASNTPLLGQATAANSVPVIQASNPDIRPGQQHTVVVDNASTTTAGNLATNYITGTPTANSAFTQAINGVANVSVSVSAVTGTLSFELSIDGAIWVGMTMRQRGSSYTVSSTTGVGIFEGDIGGKAFFRCRQISAGASTFTLTFTTNPNGIQVMNPVKLFDNTSGSQATIKAASTAPLATDTAIVVTQSPNSIIPLSVGAANIAASQVSVTSTATLISAARTGAPGTGRVDITIENFGSTDVFLGGSGVTISTGMKLPGNPGANTTITTTAAIYGIVASGNTQTVSALETY